MTGQGFGNSGSSDEGEEAEVSVVKKSTSGWAQIKKMVLDF